MIYETILVETQGRVQLIILNRPLGCRKGPLKLI
jgi:hypothetical protein